METTAVSPAEIDAFLADECGLEYYEAGWGRAEACIQDENQDGWNLFTESLDALFAPGGPVSKCRERGLMAVDVASDGETYTATITRYVSAAFWHTAEASTPAMALAEACYKALK
jgi:hypothetical protein